MNQSGIGRSSVGPAGPIPPDRMDEDRPAVRPAVAGLPFDLIIPSGFRLPKRESVVACSWLRPVCRSDG